MAKYKFRFWFEWGCSDNCCPCLWGADDVTKEKFGYAVDIFRLPVSEELKKILVELGLHHDTALDWEYPPAPSPWTDEQYEEFFSQSRKAYEMLVRELGSDFEITYDITY